ncbi:MerR family transcriptional regulator [Leeuwenhoekiella aequorea]|nr:MerR family transcriptional regulator [Leeuwenhoekiella aequorea]
MNINEIRTNILRPIFSANDIDLTYRTINHYEKKGLLLSERGDSRSWRHFSAIEVIWLNLIASLREMGMPLVKVVDLYSKLFIEGKYGSIDKASFIIKSFEDEIIESIFYKKDLYILIFFDGSYTFHDSSTLSQWHKGVYKNEPHINIPLKNIIQNIYKKIQDH